MHSRWNNALGLAVAGLVFASTAVADDAAPIGYASVAAGLNMKEGTARMSVLRMRRHFGHLLRAEIAQTVTDPGELEAELRHLVASFAG